MDELKRWLTEQIEQHRVEPNSSLGEAISYMLKHWNELTLFLRQPGAPLDNNVCERALKKVILHRKGHFESFFKFTVTFSVQFTLVLRLVIDVSIQVCIS